MEIVLCLNQDCLRWWKWVFSTFFQLVLSIYCKTIWIWLFWTVMAVISWLAELKKITSEKRQQYHDTIVSFQSASEIHYSWWQEKGGYFRETEENEFWFYLTTFSFRTKQIKSRRLSSVLIICIYKSVWLYEGNNQLVDSITSEWNTKIIVISHDIVIADFFIVSTKPSEFLAAKVKIRYNFNSATHLYK